MPQFNCFQSDVARYERILSESPLLSTSKQLTRIISALLKFSADIVLAFKAHKALFIPTKVSAIRLLAQPSAASSSRIGSCVLIRCRCF